MAYLGNNSRQRRRGGKSSDVESQNNAFNRKKNENNDTIKIIGVIVVAVVFILILVYSLMSDGKTNNATVKPQLLRETQRVVDINQNMVTVRNENIKYAFSVPPNSGNTKNADVLIFGAPEYDVTKFAQIGVFQTLALMGYNTYGIDLFYNLPNLGGNNRELIRFIYEIKTEMKLKENIILICPKLSASLYGLPLIFSRDFNIIGAAFLYPERSLDYNINQISTIKIPFLLVKDDKSDTSSYERISNKNFAMVTVNHDHNNKFQTSLNNYLVKFLQSTDAFKSKDPFESRKNDINRMMAPESFKYNKLKNEHLRDIPRDQLQYAQKFQDKLREMNQQQQGMGIPRQYRMNREQGMERQQQINDEMDPNLRKIFMDKKLKKDDINLGLNDEYLANKNRDKFRNMDDTIKIHERIKENEMNFVRYNKENILKRQNAKRDIFGRNNKDSKRVS